MESLNRHALRRRALAALLALLPVAAHATAGVDGTPQQNPPTARGIVAFVGATVIDGSGSPPLPNTTVVVVDGVITALGPAASVTAPSGARVIDARGKFILPGFIDTNVHLTPYNFATVESWSDSAAMANGLRGARELARRGVTTVRDTYGMLSLQRAIQDRLESDTTVAARVLAAGNIIGWGDPWSYSFSGSTGGRPRTAEVNRLSAALVQGVGENLVNLAVDSVVTLVGRYLDAGPDFLKIGVTTHTPGGTYMLFAPRVLSGIVELAHGRGLRVDAHAGTPEALRAAALAGVDVLQHPEELGGYRMDDAFARDVIGRGAVCALMPAEISGEAWSRFQEHVALGGRTWPAEMPPERMRMRADSLRRLGVVDDRPRSANLIAFENKRANAELLIRLGCTVTVSTDDLAGGREMGARTLAAIEGLVELGMTPMQALVAATRNGAIAAGAADRLGTITVGRSADLILLSRDPLQDIRNIRSLEAVMVKGRLLIP